MKSAETFFGNYFFDYFLKKRALFICSEFPWYNFLNFRIQSRSKSIFQMLLISTLFSLILCNQSAGKGFYSNLVITCDV